MHGSHTITPRKLESVGQGLLGIIGGSGITDSPVMGDAPWYSFDTGYRLSFPDGSSTDGVVCAQIDEKRGVVFVPRHGLDEVCRYGPSRTQYGANIITLASLGASSVIAVSATGSMRDGILEKSLVIPDDYIDESWRDPNLFGMGIVVHTNPLPAFSEGLRKILLQSALEPKDKGLLEIWDDQVLYDFSLINGTFQPSKESKSPFSRIISGGTYVCIPGDNFGTKAEGIRRATYSHVVGMTLCPESIMAMQCGMHYAVAAIPVDINFDANHEEKTLKNMRELSEPDKLPSYMERVVQHAIPFAKNAEPLSNLKGNIIPGNLERIANPHLRSIAERLIETYVKGNK